MVGTLEYAIDTDKLTEDGELWAPEEEDTTLDRSPLQGFRGRSSNRLIL